jgi:hypothetical protein
MDTAQHSRRAACVSEVQKPLLEQAQRRQAETCQEVKFALVPQIPACDNVKGKMVPKTGFEPARSFDHRIPGTERLPIPATSACVATARAALEICFPPLLLLLSLFSFRLNLSR